MPARLLDPLLPGGLGLEEHFVDEALEVFLEVLIHEILSFLEARINVSINFALGFGKNGAPAENKEHLPFA